jgi:hypothetical protein
MLRGAPGFRRVIFVLLFFFSIKKTSAGKIATEKNQNHIPNVAWFSIFSERR